MGRVGGGRLLQSEARSSATPNHKHWNLYRSECAGRVERGVRERLRASGRNAMAEINQNSCVSGGADMDRGLLYLAGGFMAFCVPERS